MSLMEEFGQSKYEAGEQKGEKRGIVKARHEIAVNLLKEGLPLELISQVTGCLLYTSCINTAVNTWGFVFSIF